MHASGDQPSVQYWDLFVYECVLKVQNFESVDFKLCTSSYIVLIDQGWTRENQIFLTKDSPDSSAFVGGRICKNGISENKIMASFPLLVKKYISQSKKYMVTRRIWLLSNTWKMWA